jgi:hypothetical protein
VQPVVVNGRSGDQRERNLELGTSWFQNPDEWAAMPADDGPDEWQRIDAVVDETRREVSEDGEKTRVDVLVPGEPIEPVALPAAQVSNVSVEEQSLSFDVDRTGVPVLVKVSYFPNWEAAGAEGPYRIGPNMMVVVPTANHVELTYGRTPVDYITMLLTLVGIGLCFVWRRQGDVVHAAEVPVARWWRRESSAVSTPGVEPVVLADLDRDVDDFGEVDVGHEDLDGDLGEDDPEPRSRVIDPPEPDEDTSAPSDPSR